MLTSENVSMKIQRKRNLTGPERVILLFWMFVIKLFCGTSWYRIALTNGYREGGRPGADRVSNIIHY